MRCVSLHLFLASSLTTNSGGSSIFRTIVWMSYSKKFGTTKAESMVVKKNEMFFRLIFNTKVRAFGAVTRNQGGKRLASPRVAVWPFAMNQFTLIAICLGLASSALGTCTSSIPSR
jgi:hypothetical protein